MAMIFDGVLFADYHQVYLCDTSDPHLPEEWTEDNLRQRINLTDHALVISTARNTWVPFKLELHQNRPSPDLVDVDHAIEASLRVPSGKLVVAGSSDYGKTASQVAVPAGDLRALVLSSGLGTLSEDGLDGDDRYHVHLWPEKPSAVVVLRRWDGDV
jgi:hypothetical protein